MTGKQAQSMGAPTWGAHQLKNRSAVRLKGMSALPPIPDIGWIAAMLRMRGRGHFNDADVMQVAMLALTGLADIRPPQCQHDRLSAVACLLK
jgi:hypothetical protein